MSYLTKNSPIQMLQKQSKSHSPMFRISISSESHSPHAATVTSLSVALQQICDSAVYIEASSTGIGRRKDRSDGKTRKKT
jgi:hypothetical protein